MGGEGAGGGSSVGSRGKKTKGSSRSGRRPYNFFVVFVRWRCLMLLPAGSPVGGAITRDLPLPWPLGLGWPPGAAVVPGMTGGCGTCGRPLRVRAVRPLPWPPVRSEMINS